MVIRNTLPLCLPIVLAVAVGVQAKPKKDKAPKPAPVEASAAIPEKADDKASAERARSTKVEQAHLEVSPNKTTLRLGEGVQLKAKVKGREGRVEWFVEGPSGSNVTPTGFFQAPTEAVTPATIRITASVEGSPPIKAESLIFLEAVSVAIKTPVIQLPTAQTYQFKATVKGTDDQRIRWAVDGGSEAGQISDTGLYTSPTRFLTPGTVTVRAISMADPSKSATATVRIGAVGIKVQPLEVVLRHGGSRRFEAKVTGSPHTAVNWSVLGEGNGEISPSGVYTTPATMATPCVVTVVASCAADPSKTASVRVRILPITISAHGPTKTKKKKPNAFVSVAHRTVRTVVRKVTRLYLPFNPLDMIIPGPVFKDRQGKQYVPLGGGVPLDAVVANTNNDRVSWEIEGSQIGEISPDGYYQAPETLTTPQVIQVRAVSHADPGKSVLYTLHIPPVVVRTEEKAPQVCPLDGALQLKARVENTENDRIVWSVEGGDKFGTVSENGLYAPPKVLATPAVVRVRAASAADPSKFTSIQVEIPELKVEVSPDDTDVKPGQVVRLKAKVKGCLGQGEVVWAVTPAIGTITPDGVYRAPETPGAQVVQISATLKSDPTKVAICTVKIRGN